MRIELVAPNEEQRIRRGRSFDYDKLATRTRQIRTAETGHSKDDDDIQIVETIIVNSPKAAPSPQWADSQRKTLVTRTDLIGHHEPPSCSTMTTPPSTGHWPLIPGQLLLNSSLIGSELTDRLPWINSKTKWLPGNQLPVADGLGLPLPIPPKATELNVVDPNDKKAPCPVINCHQVKRPSSIYSHTECTNTTVPPAFEQESLSDCDDQLPALNEETIETYLRNKFTRRLDSDPLKMTIGGCGHCSTSATSSVNGAMMEEISEMAEAMLPRPIRIADSKHELVMAAKLLYFGIERIVRACQVLTPFRMMTDPDQGALLRGGVSEMLLLRSVYHFDFGASCWEFASKRNSGHMTSTRLDLLVLKQINDVMFTNYLNFVTLIGDKWRKNNVVLSMLTAIVLFSPNRSDLIDREAVRASQRCYCHLLKRYLASVEGSQRASVTYHKLMVSLDQLKLLRDDYESATFNLTETEVSLLHSCFCGLSI
ncbi:Nuclear hormone receptor HR96 [Halotydeus destructor]|nr:Nuclear hormone receptor HR96 [Halotydeus destructor]